MKILITLTLIILSMFSYLRSEEDKTYKIDIDSKGVKTFYNKNIPADPNFKIELKQIGEITSDYLDSLGAPKFMVLDFDCDKDGNIIILDYNLMWKFSRTGRFIKKWARQGNGPGELTNPFHFYIFDNTINVLNSPNIIKFNDEGKFICNILIKFFSDYPSNIFSVSNNFLLGSKEYYNVETKRKADKIVMYDPKDFKVIKTLFEREYKKKGSMFSYDDILLYAGNEKVFFVVDNSYDEYKIDCYDSKTGKMKYKIRKNHIRVKNDEIVKDHFGVAPGGEKIKIQTGTSKFKEAINEIFYDQYDRLWVNPNSRDIDEEEDGMYFDIFKDGVFQNRLRFDMNFTSINCFKLNRNKIIEYEKGGNTYIYEFK